VMLKEETVEDLLLYFTVLDTGPGIAKDAQTKIFDAFSQADGSMARRHEGTGLGLAISKQLVEMMGGGIGVESKQGKGSLFWFTVRFGHGRNIAEQNATATMAKGETMEGSIIERKMRVLLAEDNPVNQEVEKLVLEALGCHVDVVENGLLAVEAVSGGEYDLVFMDCQMPEMDGYEATKKIRELESVDGEEIRRVAIVALTAHAMEGDREYCLEAGMDDYLSKPFNPGQMETILKRWARPEKTAGI
jgi:CheY-like chemotaxis protein